MGNLEETINQILAQFGSKKFSNNYWSKNIFQYDDTSWDLNALLSISNIDRILSESKLNSNSLRMAQDGKPVAVHTYADFIDQEYIINPDKVLGHYNNGASIILSKLEKHHYPLAELCNGMIRNLGFVKECYANVYITPPSSQTFDAHYDEQDVFILQLEGDKIWKVFQPKVKYPMEEQSYQELTEDDLKDKVVADIKLNKNSMLYVPRGFVHEVKTTMNSSIHITLSVVPYTWYDLLSLSLKKVLDHSQEIRKQLPVELFDQIDKDSLSKYENLWSSLNNTQILNEVIEQFRKTKTLIQKPLVKGMFKNVYEKPELDSNTILFCKEHGNIDLVNEGELVSINLNQKRLKLPSDLQSELDFIINNNEFSINQIPSDYDDESKILIVQRLLEEGVLTLVEV